MRSSVDLPTAISPVSPCGARRDGDVDGVEDAAVALGAVDAVRDDGWGGLPNDYRLGKSSQFPDDAPSPTDVVTFTRFEALRTLKQFSEEPDRGPIKHVGVRNRNVRQASAPELDDGAPDLRAPVSVFMTP